MSKDKIAKSYLVAVAAPSSIDGFFRPARLGALFLRARFSHLLLKQTAARAIQLCGERERERDHPCTQTLPLSNKNSELKISFCLKPGKEMKLVLM